jgi:hypothetical protein
MRHVVKATLAIGLCLAGAALAESTADRPVVVELYTSQGCASCPAADEYFSTLASHPDVIALALHVDYWDYIGWKDDFAQPRFTERQKTYARAIGSRMIYTPQIIVGGSDRVEGNQPAEVAALVERHRAQAPDVNLSLSRQGNQLLVKAEALRPLEDPLRVQLVRYRPEETVAIERGENAGRTMTYHNIVTSWEPVGDWTGEAPLSINLDVPGDDPAVVILQEAGPSDIVAAARVD